MEKFDAVIVGAGIIGCSVARRLAGQGARVCLIDRSAPGTEASYAAAGMLAPSAEAESPSPLFSFARASRERYAALATELLAETGIDPNYRSEGTLLPFATGAEGDTLGRHLAWQSACGVPLRRLAPEALRQAEPQLVDCAGAWFLPEDHQIDNRLLMQALVRSCRMRGVSLQLGQPVLRLLVHAGRTVGVEIGPAASPRTITATNVINASGAWAGQLAGAGIPALPLRPVKGHMLALRAPLDTLRHVVRTPDVYLIPRRDGRIIVGSTMEEAGFDKTVHAAPLARLLSAAQAVCPALGQAEWLEGWAGLRPATPDGLPIIGPMPGVANCWVALGHFRNGILLAPVTADALSEWILQSHPSLDLSAFQPDRFLPSSGSR